MFIDNLLWPSLVYYRLGNCLNRDYWDLRINGNIAPQYSLPLDKGRVREGFLPINPLIPIITVQTI